MELTLGPIPYFWEKQAVIDFYAQVAESPFDTVVLGETVCSKRRQLNRRDWLEIAQVLRQHGKQVLMATLALIEAESELGALRALCQEASELGILVEANDYAAVHLLSSAGVPFAGGASLNLYNANSLKVLRDMGLVRWQPPLEASRDQIASILEGQSEGLCTDLMVWGFMTLAYSARCYTARVHGVAKDECGFVCLQHPQGLKAASQDGTELFTLNGIQTQSGRPLDLRGIWQEARAIGVSSLRLTADGPAALDRVRELKRAIDGDIPLGPNTRLNTCNGYWHRIAGMASA